VPDWSDISVETKKFYLITTSSPSLLPLCRTIERQANANQLLEFAKYECGQPKPVLQTQVAE
jgi:hypothetical protein